MTTPWLLTGVTQGLGASILDNMLNKFNYPATSIIATSRSESQRGRFESQGVRFRVLDYDRPDTLARALEGVENFFFVASPERDTDRRNAQHRAVLDAAVAAGVKRIWYNSLAFGGYGDDSKIGFQQAHYETETQLMRTGLDFVNVRAGVYADAFPLFLNWYPSSKEVLLPTLDPPTFQGLTAYASRMELGEAHASLFAKGLKAFPSIKPRGPKNIILLTGPKAESLEDVAEAIGRAKGSKVPVRFLDPLEWIEVESKDDIGGKGNGWFEARLVYTKGVCAGDAAHVDPAMETLLGRRPESGTETVERLVREDPGYTWHQNHVKRAS